LIFTVGNGMRWAFGPNLGRHSSALNHGGDGLMMLIAMVI